VLGRGGGERAAARSGTPARAFVAGVVPAVAGPAGAGVGGFAESAGVSRMARGIEWEACKPRGRPCSGTRAEGAFDHGAPRECSRCDYMQSIVAFGMTKCKV
jgi:hypothetical protein